MGLDHGVGHFRPLRIMAKVLERLVLSIVRCFCVAQKQKGVADAMIEAVKCVLGCRHLLSQAANGVRMQVYVALIASLLISLWVERAPTKRTYEMCCFSLSGWASET